ncbi:hypothetical protein XA68_10462 [Ophiocordyceps unilateralis]|uniref:Uncharacterized protein n=1 Tax=Ophiocordyceps unilateralis TaxID=268505 RepID=A0A2A9P1Z6_OPHUN|nr:hypothetical protein XA68_10462 [Ophiocordyceps unilateralis]
MLLPRSPHVPHRPPQLTRLQQAQPLPNPLPHQPGHEVNTAAGIHHQQILPLLHGTAVVALTKSPEEFAHTTLHTRLLIRLASPSASVLGLLRV